MSPPIVSRMGVTLVEKPEFCYLIETSAKNFWGDQKVGGLYVDITLLAIGVVACVRSLTTFNFIRTLLENNS